MKASIVNSGGGKMVRLSEEQRQALEGSLPAHTLSFLCDPGVPEVVDFHCIEHVFTLDMEPILDGRAFRIGSVDRGWYAMAVERETGHFGYAFSEPERPPWVFCNTSVAHFLECFAACERVWQMEQDKQIAREDGGEVLDREIRRIDPAVFADENNIWSVLVEEVRAGLL